MLKVEDIRFNISIFIQILVVFIEIIGEMLTTKIFSGKVERDCIITELGEQQISNDRLQLVITLIESFKEGSSLTFARTRLKTIIKNFL